MTPAVSPAATGTLVAMVVVVAALFVWAAGFGARTPGEPAATTTRWTALAAAAAVLWLGVSAGIASSGVLLEFSRVPPPFMVFMTATFVATTLLAFSPLGRRLATGIGFAGLIGFQVFRVPVELWLHRLFVEGVVPVQMTYSGRNFDLVSGVLAAVVGVWCLKGRPPHGALAAFNVIGLALLINIVVIAIGSTPTPLRFFLNEPANTFVGASPFIWLPAFLVQAAWFGHLLVFRRLKMRLP